MANSLAFCVVQILHTTVGHARVVVAACQTRAGLYPPTVRETDCERRAFTRPPRPGTHIHRAAHTGRVSLHEV